MAQESKNGKLAVLILIVVAIVIAVALIGTVCTCLCTCGSCLSGITDVVAFETIAPLSTAAPVFETPAPAESAAPAPSEAPASLSPLDWDGQVSASVQDPAPSVRKKKVHLKNDGTDTATVLVLMNGSDLESEYREATEDLREMVRAEKSDRVQILIETVGTKQWDPTFGISSRRSQRYRVTDRGLTLLDDTLGQLDTTIPSTLSDFIRWGVETAPADRYILLLWNHGGGPVYGFGYDEFQPYTATLTIDEIQTALSDGGTYFDLIGMDCCLMSSIEVCSALYEYCDYTLLSEDFEPACGWSHSEWLTALAKNPAIPTTELGRIAIDASVKAAERNAKADGGLTLALVDEAYMALLCPAWIEFAYANETALLSANYSQLRQSTGRARPAFRAVGGWSFGDEHTLDDYCITDILSLALTISSPESDALCAALDQAIAYYSATSNETTLAGLSVTLPYGDAAFYNELRRVFLNAGIDAPYVQWLNKFVSVETETAYYDFGGFEGWDDYTGGYDWSDWYDTFGDWDDWDVGEGLGDLLSWLFG